MIITCPHCSARYEVAAELVGTAGRKVLCAECQVAWEVRRPTADALFDDGEERRLDALFQAEAAETVRQQQAPPPPRPLVGPPRPIDSDPPVDPARARQIQAAFKNRLSTLEQQLPAARIRRLLRFVAAAVLVGCVTPLALARVEIVKQYPELAAIYGALGMPVNVVGIVFDEPKATSFTREGRPFLAIRTTLRNIAGEPVSVPGVIVTMINAKGAEVYEWSLNPGADIVEAGESEPLYSEFPSPPLDAVLVRLTFTTARLAKSGGSS